jgi:hypothetical protein
MTKEPDYLKEMLGYKLNPAVTKSRTTKASNAQLQLAVASINKEKAHNWFQLRGLQFPKRGTNRPSTTNIITEKDTVNLNNKPSEYNSVSLKKNGTRNIRLPCVPSGTIGLSSVPS